MSEMKVCALGTKVKHFVNLGLTIFMESLPYATPDPGPALGHVPAAITPYFTDKETAAQRGSWADPTSHSQGEVDMSRCHLDTELQVSVRRKITTLGTELR